MFTAILWLLVAGGIAVAALGVVLAARIRRAAKLGWKIAAFGVVFATVMLGALRLSAWLDDPTKAQLPSAPVVDPSVGTTTPMLSGATDAPPRMAGPDDDAPWTYEHPTPGRKLTSQHLNAIWGASDSDIWAVGGDGTLLHRDSTEWTLSKVPDGAGLNLQGLWGSTSTDVWTVDHKGGAHHWDGRRWTSSPIAKDVWMTAIAGSGPRDVWAVGNVGQPSEGNFRGVVYRWDGSAWSAEATPADSMLTSVVVPAKNDVWVVGPAIVLHHDGSRWERLTPRPKHGAFKVWAASPRDVWLGSVDASNGCFAAGQRGSVRGWKDTTCGIQSALFGTSGDDVFGMTSFTAFHWDGSRWRYQKNLPYGVAHAGWSGKKSVWMVGEGGAILRRAAP